MVQAKRPLVKCPKCGEIVRARHASFRHCKHSFPVDEHKVSSNLLNPKIETDPVKEAIAERLEKGELSGSADVMVKGVPVHVEFTSKGAPNNPGAPDNPCSPDNPKVEDEGKVKVFNPAKLSNPKADVKTESKIEKVIEGGEEEGEAEDPDKKEMMTSRIKGKNDNCPRCYGELHKPQKISLFGLFSIDNSEGKYLWCPNCHRPFEEE